MIQTERLSQAERDTLALQAARQLADDVLRPVATHLDQTGEYPTAALRALAEAGLMGMSIPVAEGGLELSHRATAELFATLTEGCLAICFIVTQHQGCAAILTASNNSAVRARWLPALANGQAHGSNGFNFLNLPPERATMRAVPVAGGFRLNGVLPWVTAAHHCDVVAAGAVLPDHDQIMVAVAVPEAVAAGTARIEPPMALAALTASDTTAIHFLDLFVPEADLVAGPAPEILKTISRSAATYVPTAMTAGHARASLAVLEAAAARKGGPAAEMAAWVQRQSDRLYADIMAALDAEDYTQAPTLRARGNVLCARAAHCALIAGGGTGYRQGETAQRLYREAGFFSVWSVSGATLPAMLPHLLPDSL